MPASALAALFARRGNAAEIVRRQIEAGQVKRTCCRSKKRCRRCPVLALKRVKAELKGTGK